MRPTGRHRAPARMEISSCEVCGSEFERLVGRKRRWCNEGCRAELSRRATSAWRASHPNESAGHLERQREARLAMPLPPCSECGGPIEWSRKGRRPLTCSDECRRTREHARTQGTGASKSPTAEPRLGRAICAQCQSEFEFPIRRGRPPTLCSGDCKRAAARVRASTWFREHPDRVAEYRVANRDRILQANRDYARADPDWARERARRWQEANPDRVVAAKERSRDSGADRERAKRSRMRDPEGYRQRLRERYWADPVTARLQAKEWAQLNPEKMRAMNRRNNRRRKAARRGATKFDSFDSISVFERDGWTCQLCGEAIDPGLGWPDRMCATLDHVKPVARGGQDTLDNVQAAHYSCNSSKRHWDAPRTPIEVRRVR